ncbi:LysM peptidoglycan-binding domain-containing protein [Halanaerobaculum tunisiense]
MTNSLELANKLLQQEKENQPLYSQLKTELDDPRYERITQALRNLQARQINILNTIIEELEKEPPTPPSRRYYIQHILQPGESLQTLAREYNTTVSQIREVNPNLSDEPQSSQLINLPIEIPEPPTDHIKYYVRSKDTLYNIARRYNIDIDTLVRLNNIADPNVLFPGRILIIPGD